MKLKQIISVFILLAFAKVIQGQRPKIDSLRIALSQEKSDTSKVKLLMYLSDLTVQQMPDSCLSYNKRALEICENGIKKHAMKSKTAYINVFYYNQKAVALDNVGYFYNLHGDFQSAVDAFNTSLQINKEFRNYHDAAIGLNNLAFVFNNQGLIEKAIQYYQESIRYCDSTKNLKLMAACFANLANIYNNRAEHSKATELFMEALSIREKINDKAGIAKSMMDLAIICEEAGELEKAKLYFNKSIKMNMELGDKRELSTAYNNLGFLYKSNKEYSLALQYYFQSLALRKEIKFHKGVANSYNNIAKLYMGIEKNDSALKYFHKSLDIRENIGDKSGMATCYNNISELFFKNKKHEKSILFAKKGLSLGMELGNPSHISSSALELCNNYKVLGNYKEALTNFELYIHMRDSVINEAFKKSALKTQIKYEFEKKAAADSVAHAKENEVKNAQLETQKAQLSIKKNQQYALLMGLLLVLLFAGFMFNRFKITQKQKKIIEKQKEMVENQKNLVEEKQKEILDSIYYARRIQLAQIPSEKQVDVLLKKSMIL
ncbi:MAG: tetratricopeptide repeat protein [Sphingobacteriaceae bacterium]|nr:tetratricopeptide repeat protein [Sphingobacteriaceae bacterium]